jgi:hypothetical protein
MFTPEEMEELKRRREAKNVTVMTELNGGTIGPINSCCG